LLVLAAVTPYHSRQARIDLTSVNSKLAMVMLQTVSQSLRTKRTNSGSVFTIEMSRDSMNGLITTLSLTNLGDPKNQMVQQTRTVLPWDSLATLLGTSGNAAKRDNLFVKDQSKTMSTW
jgi:hypothetical protein